MGIRRRRSSVLMMTIAALFSIYVYFLVDRAYFSEYEGRSERAGGLFAPLKNPSGPLLFQARKDIDSDVARLAELSERDEKEREDDHEAEDYAGKGGGDDEKKVGGAKKEELGVEKELEKKLADEEGGKETHEEEATAREKLEERERGEERGGQREERGGEGEEEGKEEEEEGGGEGPDDGSRQKEDKMKAKVGGEGRVQRPFPETKDWPQPVVDWPSSHVTRLIVLAYMRTGSSMTGRILRFSPDIFYVYEPLHTLERYYVTGGHPESPYRNKTMNEWFKASAMAAGNTSAMLSCDAAHVYSGILLDPFMALGDDNNQAIHRCFKAAAASHLDNPSRARMWAECETNMTQICRHAYKVTAVKTIRLTMARALEIMRRDPKVKVLHLTRDPRGILLSRKNIGFANFAQLKAEASLLCRKIQEDLNWASDPKAVASADELQLKTRYRLVRYEDIATAPLDFTRQLYEFMGISPTDQVLDSVRKMMDSAKHRKDCPTCRPTKLNSTEVSQAWRQTLTVEQVEDISGNCAGVMELLGYRVKFDGEAGLRDPRISAVGPVKFKLN